MDPQVIRLVTFSLPAKILLTVFLLLIGAGYVTAILNIHYHHQDADLETGLSLDDLRRVYHGLNKRVSAETRPHVPSDMEKMVRPGGEMRSHLEDGGEAAVRTLTAWLEAGSREADFVRVGLVKPDDPSPQQVITAQCVSCHNAADGLESEVPYAASSSAMADYALVLKEAAPGLGETVRETQVLHLPPTDSARLLHTTHAHILAMPVFALMVGGLFLLTGLPQRVKLLVGPAPLLALCVDFASWWLARPFEPFVYLIAAAGGVFGVGLGVQIVCVFLSMWFGRGTYPDGGTLRLTIPSRRSRVFK